MRFSLGRSFSSSEIKFSWSHCQKFSLITTQHAQEWGWLYETPGSTVARKATGILEWWTNKPIVDCRSLALDLGSKCSLSQKGILGRSQLRRRALSSSGRRRSHLPLSDPQPPPGRTQWPGGPPQRPSVQGLERVCRKQSRKSHLGTCVTLTCSYSPGPGEPRSPCKFGIGPPGPLTLPRCAAQSAGGGGGVSQLMGCDRGWERRQLRQVLAERPGSPRCHSLRLAAEGLRQDASSARRGRQDAAVRRSGAPYRGQRPALPARPPQAGEYEHPNIRLRAAAETGFPMPLLSSRSLGSHRRTSFLGQNLACESITRWCFPFHTSNHPHNVPERHV